MFLYDARIDALDVPEEGEAVFQGDERSAPIRGDGLVREHADDEAAQFAGLADDGDVSAVDDVRREAHVDGPVFDFPEARGDDGEILGGVDFRAEAVLDIVGVDAAGIRDFVERLLRITLSVVMLAKLADFVQPEFPFGVVKFIERLRLHRTVKELDADGFHKTILYHRLEVLLGQRQRGADLHAAVLAVQHVVQHRRLEDEVAVHEQDVVVPQMLPCAVDGVDVIGLAVERVVDKGEVQRQTQRAAVVDQHTVEVASRHDHLCDTGVRDQAQLSRQDGFRRRDLRHALRMLARQDAHAVPEPRIQDECFHFTVMQLISTFTNED